MNQLITQTINHKKNKPKSALTNKILKTENKFNNKSDSNLKSNSNTTDQKSRSDNLKKSESNKINNNSKNCEYYELKFHSECKFKNLFKKLIK